MHASKLIYFAHRFQNYFSFCSRTIPRQWSKITFRGPVWVPKVSFGVVLVFKSSLRILIWAPQVPFSVPPKTPKMGVLGYFGGTENGTSGAQIKILKSLFNTNTPLKPPFSHFGNNFRPRKSDFWPFYWFWSFSHWNSHWSRKILRTAEGRVVHQKQKLFWKSETKWNNLKPCRN